jgi:hypothetical protein
MKPATAQQILVARSLLLIATLTGLSAATPLSSSAQAAADAPGADLRITTLSNHPHLISGGNALVRIDVPSGTSLRQVRIARDGTDITPDFQPIDGEHALMGRVAGLSLGRQHAEVSAQASDGSEYPVQFTRPEWARLQSVFPTGVCDWGDAGVGQRRVEPWPSIGPSPETRIDR